MSRLAPQHMSENTIIRQRERGRIAAVLGGEAADDGAEQNGDEGCALHQRVAGGKLRARRWSGRMPYLIGPNSEAITPNRNSAKNSNGTEVHGRKPSTAMKAMPISANLSRRATTALS